MKHILLALLLAFSSFSSIQAQEGEIKILKDAVSKALKEGNKEKFYSYFAWEGTHFIFKDQIKMFWDDPLKYLGEKDELQFSDIEWIAVEDFNEQQKLNYNTIRSIEGRSYVPNHPVVGIFLVNFSDAKNKEDETRGISYPIVIGQEKSGKLYLNTTKIVTDKKKLKK